ncbi:uncharacterized protein METZ01_LOCUS16742, partial [marine metagenome]
VAASISYCVNVVPNPHYRDPVSFYVKALSFAMR